MSAMSARVTLGLPAMTRLTIRSAHARVRDTWNAGTIMPRVAVALALMIIMSLRAGANSDRS